MEMTLVVCVGSHKQFASALFTRFSCLAGSVWFTIVGRTRRVWLAQSNYRLSAFSTENERPVGRGGD